VKIVLLRFVFAAALSMSSSILCGVVRAQSHADIRPAHAVAIFEAAPTTFTPSFPASNDSLFVDAAGAPHLLVTSSKTSVDAGDPNAFAPSFEASPAEPAPSRASLPASIPEPKPSTYYEQFPRKWELSLAFALVRFRSSIYEASAPGLNSSLTYWWKDRLAFEGSATSAFAPPVYANEHFRYLGYGAGPKFSFGHGRLDPWAHALVGGVHLIPQTASGGQNGFEVTMGGGIDYAINDVISAKGGVDYLGTHMFGQWQSSVQIVAGLALRF